MNLPLDDQAARDEALDISRSFIVQAPAGSGKTGLLTLRFLKLLTISEQPEQIIAITFTRKAASEMRDRIVKTLLWAEELEASENSPTESADRQRFDIAKKALARDKHMHWQLLQNPSRLRVQTIDSFCFNLASQLPILSRLGGNPRITEQVDHCFRDAIANTFLQLESDRMISADIEKVLIHLDNDIERLERLLINLLKRRDQWLSYVLEINDSGDDTKLYVEACIQELIEESILEVKTELEPYAELVITLTNFSIDNLQKLETPKHVGVKQFEQLPGASIDDVLSWKIIVDLLLTQAGSWRRTIDKRSGFPAGDKENKEHQVLCKKRKEEIKGLLEQLSENSDLLNALIYLRFLPTSSINNKQWEFLTSLTHVMALLSSELLISFRRFGLIDYIQIGAAARTALGSNDNPTDLTLSLDFSIQHILIDEFQDTSQLQLEILQQLISGWMPDEQRSLFMVGDAMQSCYGFRNANVGIYLNVQQNGLPHLDIQSLKLQTNFRSDANIVNWVNRHFYTAFPTKPNPSRGAVPFSHSEAIKSANDAFAVSTELISFETNERYRARETEARQVIETIEEIREKFTDESIAILVRSRNDLNFIMPELRNNGIEWASNDIDRMGTMQIVEDLLSLTKALLNPYDRLSWFSILRAPWTGLLASDLHAIAQSTLNQSVWLSLNKPENIKNISNDGKRRLKDFVECVSPAMKYRYRISLRELIQTCWELLRGAAVIKTNRETVCVTQYLNLLGDYESAGGITNLELFQEQVHNSFIPAFGNANLDHGSNPIQLLTMHKAKGLEFDHVIIPCLANRTGSDDKPLFTWHERLNKHGQARLFIAALTETGTEDDELYQLIRHEKKHKSLLENTRLLYIAITRAKKSVKLLGTVSLNSKQELQVPPQSLLSRIWSELQRESINLQIKKLEPLTSHSRTEEPDPFPLPTPIKRFSKTQGLNKAERCFLKNEVQRMDREIENNKGKPCHEDPNNSCIGDLIHEFLEDYTNSKDKVLFLKEIMRNKDYWKLQLRKHTQTTKLLNNSLDFITSTIKRTIGNKDLQWIFDNSAANSESEFPISTIKNGRMKTYIIDRTFIDQEGVRWIIDYKTGAPKDGNETEFVERQSILHAPQLIQYKELFGKLESRQIRTALLFTSIPKLVEI